MKREGADAMIALLMTISMILTIIWWIFLIMIIMSWLINFNVINTRNQFVASVWRILNQITEPILRPIRRIVPPVGGLDLSPIIVFIILFFLQSFIANDLPRLLGLY
jgi:YggT family protein